MNKNDKYYQDFIKRANETFGEYMVIRYGFVVSEGCIYALAIDDNWYFCGYPSAGEMKQAES